MTEYLFGSTLRLDNTFKDLDDALYDPTTLSLSITDPEGTVKKTVTYAANEIKRTSVGVFYYDYDIPATGVSGYWVASWDANITLQTDISEIQFYVRDVAEKLLISVAEVKGLLITDKITLSDDNIRMAIRSAAEEVSTITGRVFTNNNTETEYFSILTPNSATVINKLFLTKLPAQSIISLKEYDTSKELVETYESDDYYLDDNGIVTLMTGGFGKGIRRVECSYHYGYQSTPGNIRRLAGVIARIDILINYVMSTDDASTGFTVDGIGSVSIGEPYVSSIRILERLEKQKNELVAEIGDLRMLTFIV